MGGGRWRIGGREVEGRINDQLMGVDNITDWSVVEVGRRLTWNRCTGTVTMATV